MQDFKFWFLLKILPKIPILRTLWAWRKRRIAEHLGIREIPVVRKRFEAVPPPQENTKPE